MKINLLILGIILVVTAFATSLLTNHQPVVTAPKAAADFAYTDINGQKGSLYDHQGKIILLHFWATWCAPCVIEFPNLIDLAEGQKDKLVIFAISVDKDKKNINKFFKKLKLEIPANFIVIQDADKAISEELYQTYKLPESTLLSKDLVKIEKIIGPQENWNDDQWNQKISTLSSE